jgi:iron complex outermembrane receptor protein
VQIGEVRVRGVELEGRGEVAPGFDVILAGAYTDAIITQGSPAVRPTATNSGTPTTTGTRQLGTPEWQATGFLSYDLGRSGVSGAIGGLSLGAGVRYVGGSAGSTSYKVVNNVTTFEAFTTEDFTLVDAMVGYDLSFLGNALEGWSVALNAANLLDKRYISACPFSNSCYFGASRTMTGSLRFKW